MYSHLFPAPLDAEATIEAVEEYLIAKGEPITALCGLVWIPVRDDNDYEACSECRKRLDEGIVFEPSIQ